MKLMVDAVALNLDEANNYCAELSDQLQSYDRDYYIGDEEETDWKEAVQARKPNLFCIGKNTEDVSLLAVQVYFYSINFDVGQWVK